jgi:membrane protein DedA with SNARE-associated domain
MFMLTFIGKTAGENWEDWKIHLHWIDYAVAAMIVIGGAYLGIRWLRGRNSDGADEQSDESGATPANSPDPADA